MRSAAAVLRAMFRTLWRLWGPQHWWPAESQFEVIVGAYLTQNTSWTNVERALANLRDANAMSVDAIREIPLARLEELIRPSGYFRQKAERLKRFIAFLDERYGGSLNQMFAEPTAKLRDELLSLNGVGPETADSILLYVGGHEVFVVDAYTRRVLERHDLLPSSAGYEEIRALFENAFAPFQISRFPFLEIERSVRAARPETTNEKGETALYGAAHPPSAASEMQRSERAQVFSEMHAFIVGIGKNYCLKSAPLCEVCPLKKYLPKKPVSGFAFPVSGSRGRIRQPK
jgi:endonuclease-3 related protein